MSLIDYMGHFLWLHALFKLGGSRRFKMIEAEASLPGLPSPH